MLHISWKTSVKLVAIKMWVEKIEGGIQGHMEFIDVNDFYKEQVGGVPKK